MAYNDKDEIKHILKDLGLNKKDIQKVNKLHEMTVKMNGGEAFPMNGGEAFPKTDLSFDKETMAQIRKAHELAKKIDKNPFGRVTLRKREGGGPTKVDQFVNGTVKTIQRLLPDMPHGVNTQDRNGNTALHVAAKHSNVEAIKFLLSKDANIHIQNNSGDTADFIALRSSCKKCIDMMKNADKSQADASPHSEEKPMTENAQMISRGGSILFVIATWSGMVAIPVMWAGAFGVAWPVLVKILDRYANGQELTDKSLTQFCKVMMYLLPATMIGFFVTNVNISFASLASGNWSGAFSVKQNDINTIEALTAQLAEAAKKNVDPNAATTGQSWFNTLGSTIRSVLGFNNKHVEELVNNEIKNKDPAGTLQLLKNAFVKLYEIAILDSGGSVSGSKIVITAAVIYFIGNYMYTIFSGDRERFEEMQQSIYSNNKRRIQIMEFHLKKAKHEEKERDIQKAEYDKKVEEKLQQYFEKSKGATTTSEATKQDTPNKWYKFDPTRPDEDALYVFNKSKRSKTKTSSSTKKRRLAAEAKANEAKAAEAKDDAAVLANLEKMIQNENKS